MGLVEVDTMSWWCGNGGGSTAGIAFVGALCSSYNINLNEKQSSIASSGYVSSIETMLLSSSCIMISLPKYINIIRINNQIIDKHF